MINYLRNKYAYLVAVSTSFIFSSLSYAQLAQADKDAVKASLTSASTGGVEIGAMILVALASLLVVVFAIKMVKSR